MNLPARFMATASSEDPPDVDPAESPGWFAQAARGLRARRRSWLYGLPVLLLRSGEPLPLRTASWVLRDLKS